MSYGCTVDFILKNDFRHSQLYLPETVTLTLFAQVKEYLANPDAFAAAAPAAAAPAAAAEAPKAEEKKEEEEESDGDMVSIYFECILFNLMFGM